MLLDDSYGKMLAFSFLLNFKNQNSGQGGALVAPESHVSRAGCQQTFYFPIFWRNWMSYSVLKSGFKANKGLFTCF